MHRRGFIGLLLAAPLALAAVGCKKQPTIYDPNGLLDNTDIIAAWPVPPQGLRYVRVCVEGKVLHPENITLEFSSDLHNWHKGDALCP